MSFENLNLNPKILKAINEAGYTEATKIQEKAIPKIVQGFDIRASAQTGTGKTAAFLLPALNRLAIPAEKKGKGPRVLILAPTRELAMQITTQAEKYSKYLHGLKTVCVYGGVPYHIQSRKLSRPYDILVATPGRLIDFINQRKISLSRVELLVLDEADRMLDMGFLEPVEEIVEATPTSRQTLLFSATLDGSIAKLSARFQKDPMEIVVHSKKEKHENIEQKLHYVDDLHHKNRILEHLLSNEDIQSAIIFTSTKRHADQLEEELQDKGFHAAALHGDMNQRQRTRTIQLLQSGRIKIVVATDVAARGIDVQSISHVINFDLPRQTEDYVHRIGRTGRAGSQGTAISLAVGRDAGLVKRIEEFTGQAITVVEIKGMEPRPLRKQGAGGAGRRRPRSRPFSDRGGPNPHANRNGNQRFKFKPKAKASQKGASRPKKASV
jgi:superfamily II DNA/RNA helicase